jgi:hypothetical protein
MEQQVNVIGIEVGVVIPVEVENRYPYKDMQVNESFWVGGMKIGVICNYNYRWGKKLGRKFIARREGEGIRVWRVL